MSLNLQMRPPACRRGPKYGQSPLSVLGLRAHRQVEAPLVRTAMAGHAPVLLREVINLLKMQQARQSPPKFLDCTYGGGGHAREVLNTFPGSNLVALDTDPDAAVRAEGFTQDFPGRFSFIPGNFGDLADLPVEGPFSGILFDLGVSSYHFDTADRGFSFRHDAPLDMRMNPNEGQSASEFLETASRDELVNAVRNYGEEPRWFKVVRAIESARGTSKLGRTLSFAELVASAAPAAPGSRIHPATRTFQGVRIAVNDELGVLERALPVAFDLLEEGGVLAVISFHSLEDRIVKRFFRRMAGRPEHRLDFAAQQSRIRRAELLNNRPVEPGEDELSENPRARSSRLRGLKKIRPQR